MDVVRVSTPSLLFPASGVSVRADGGRPSSRLVGMEWCGGFGSGKEGVGWVGYGNISEEMARVGNYGGRGKTKNNCIRVTEAINYALGEDVKWEEISWRAENTLVGQAL